MLDPFDQFAEQSDLHIDAEPLCVAPRDLLAPLGAIDPHFLVTLSRTGAHSPPVRLIFLIPIAASRGPTPRDVLWWVAGDAWAIERADGELRQWSAIYGYPPDAEATSWLFQQANQQTGALRTLLGDSYMHGLLT